MSVRAKLLETSGDLFSEIDEPIHEGCVALLKLWRELRPETGLPRREDFSFERLAALGIIGNCFVIEPIDGGADWQYRLLGSKITWLFGGDVTNVPFTQHFDQREAEVCIGLSNRVAKSGQPVFLVGRFRTGDFSGQLETMSLPVTGRDGQSVWLIGASFPTETAG